MMIFLSYAKEDGDHVDVIYAGLKKAGYQPWMDKHDIAGGRDWKVAIQSAQLRCDIGILCLSTRSVSKTGYVQVEVKEFVEQLKRRPTGAIYLIPLRLEPCPIPQELASQQCIDLFEKDGWGRLIGSLEEAKAEQFTFDERGEIRGGFSIHRRQIEEQWEGLPGYKVQLRYPEFRGEDAAMCAELNTVFEAKQRSTLYSLRAHRMLQDSGRWQDWAGMAMFEAITDYQIIFASEAALSIVFTNYLYEGGAHGMTLFESENFLLQPISRLPLAAFFKADSHFFAVLGELAREGLRRQAWEYSQSKDRNVSGLFESSDEHDWLVKGTTFQAHDAPEFTFSDAGLTLYFPPYQVAYYAAGTFEVTLSYYDLRDILRPDGPHQLFIARPEPS